MIRENQNVYKSDSITLSIQDLSIDMSKLSNDFFLFATDLNDFTPKDMAKDWHMEHIRRFNVSANYVFMSYVRWQSSLINLIDQNWQTEEEKIVDVQQFRFDCRDVCINISMYIDKIKALCRYYFYMDDKAEDTKIWVRTLKQFEKMKQGKYIEEFLQAATKLYDSKEYKFIADIRNDEIHNESIIELIEYDVVSDNGIKLIPIKYVISEDMLYKNIYNIIENLKVLSKAMDAMIFRIHPVSINRFWNENKGELKNVISPDDRYKNARKKEKNYNIKVSN